MTEHETTVRALIESVDRLYEKLSARGGLDPALLPILKTSLRVTLEDVERIARLEELRLQIEVLRGAHESTAAALLGVRFFALLDEMKRRLDETQAHLAGTDTPKA